MPNQAANIQRKSTSKIELNKLYRVSENEISKEWEIQRTEFKCESNKTKSTQLFPFESSTLQRIV